MNLSDDGPTALIRLSGSPCGFCPPFPKMSRGSGTGSVCSQPPCSARRWVFTDLCAGLDCGCLLVSLSGLGMRAVPASDALGRASRSPSWGTAPVLWLNICKLSSVRLWARSHCRGGFGSSFCLASCLVRLSAHGASFGRWHLAPRDSLSWDQRAGCVSCCDEMS